LPFKQPFKECYKPKNSETPQPCLPMLWPSNRE
jgi:hypothetical protein